MSGLRLERLEHHEVLASPGLADWLREEHVGLTFTNGGRLFLVGVQDDGDLSVVERAFPSCLAVEPIDSRTFFLATRYQIWRMRDAVPPGEHAATGADRLFVPQTGWTTGLLGVDDIAVGADGRAIFVNRRFSCLATLSETLNFEPVWVPPFITELLPEERCGLTGVAVHDGAAAYATSISGSDRASGWKDERRAGGLVLSVPSGEVVAHGLSLPHSPVHDGTRLLLCNGGTGELLTLDPVGGDREVITGLPGLARGLALHGGYAVVGTSRQPWDETFDDVELEDRLSRAATSAVCGVHVVDLTTGAVAHTLVIEGVGPDIADVAVLTATSRPDATAYQGEEVENLVSFFPKPPPEDATRV